jgi:glycosyltransferase involved in cell wall biosynthesis
MPLKGLGELAEAVLDLEGCELAVVGGEAGGAIDAAADRRMADALARLRSHGRLVETGPVSPEQATRSYREADVFALPTHREGFPNTLLEAMAAGLPCIATAVGAIPEMLEGDCGILVPVGDVGALREALAGLIGNAALRARLGQSARERVAERYALEAVMRRYRALYLELAAPQLLERAASVR